MEQAFHVRHAIMEHFLKMDPVLILVLKAILETHHSLNVFHAQTLSVRTAQQ